LKDRILCTSVLTLDVITAVRYYIHMILSFADKDTEKLARLERVSRFVLFERMSLRKLTQLDVAEKLDDLRVPPGNRLEQLKGDRIGQHSIRVNDQYRICFFWTDQGPMDVVICDYH
jgi:proteic killer suppression protein